MKFAIIGAGAVGGFYGALLSKAGHDVAFVADHVSIDGVLYSTGFGAAENVTLGNKDNEYGMARLAN